MENASALSQGRSCTTEADWRNGRRMIVWSLLWAVCWVGFEFGITDEWLSGGAAVAGAALLITLLGIGLLLAYGRYLREADELRRKIELEALAPAFGVGLVGGVALHLLESAGFLAEGLLFTLIMMAMVCTYIVGIVLGHRRYR